jgi:hypothetical protein
MMLRLRAAARFRALFFFGFVILESTRADIVQNSIEGEIRKLSNYFRFDYLSEESSLDRE